MKTVPTVGPAEAADAAGLPELPEEIHLAVTDITGAIREGLLAMSVAAGMAVMQAMFAAEITAARGPKASTTLYRHAHPDTAQGAESVGAA